MLPTCNQCDYRFNKVELLKMDGDIECPRCGCQADHNDTGRDTKDGETPFSYDPNQDYKTEQ